MKTATCSNCNGSGRVICPLCKGEDYGDYKKCKCHPSPFNFNDHGRGYVNCPDCKGKGVIRSY